MENYFERKDLPSVEISKGSPEDAEQIAKIQEQTWLDTYPNEEYNITEDDIKSLNFTSETRINKWKDRIEESSENRMTYVAKEGDTISGYCSVSKEDGKNMIRALYLLPSSQGKGLGLKLMQQGMEWLGEDQDIFLHVAKYNNKAIEFYKKNGFEVNEDNDENLDTNFPSGTSIPVIEMVKHLSK